MARRVEEGTVIRVHQALHGYVDGHRLIASSTHLKPRDSKMMLIMSDSSGPGSTIEKSGYLTGYPLTESGVYAFARTWSATEMSRPGCVWTHTLLLDFADLALLLRMDSLSQAFRRPKTTASFDGYDNMLFITEEASPRASYLLSSLRGLDDPLRRILSALYMYPKDRLIASSADENLSSEIVLNVWAQQWPRLRRAFRFCTLAFADRSSEGAEFDIQFLPAEERPVRSRFTNVLDVNRVHTSTEQWLDDAIGDLVQSDASDLRMFLRTVGGDIPGGREAFVPLCRLHWLIKEFAARPGAVDEAVALIEDIFPAESASTLRTLVTSAAIKHADAIGKRALAFAIDQLEFRKEPEFEQNAHRLVAALWQRDPEAVEKLIFEKGSVLGKSALASLPVEDILAGLRLKPNIASLIIERRPDLLAEPAFWSGRGSWQADALLTVSRGAHSVDSVLAAMIRANRGDLASEAATAFGNLALLRTIGKIGAANESKGKSLMISAWLETALADAKATTEALSGCFLSDRAVLLQIARKTIPDFVTNDFGEDPWIISMRHAEGTVSDKNEEYFAAYLLARALGHRSRNSGELISLSFDTVYFAAYRSSLNDEAWSLLDPRLPRSFFWPEWDRCQRLRSGVADVFVYRELAPETFVTVTKDNGLFSELVDAVRSTNKKGRKFLKRVRDKLSHNNDIEDVERLKILDGVV
jgi:GTPase-associated protein 1, N-terminal domain type 1